MIDHFRGQWRWLSNFWPCKVTFLDVTFPTVENAYQAAKFEEPDLRLCFVGLEPGDAKRLGGPKGGLSEFVRKDWDWARWVVMTNLLWQKAISDEIMPLLMGTGDEEIVEGNWWGDTFWGVCKGKGENHLGKIWMAHRSEIRAMHCRGEI